MLKALYDYGTSHDGVVQLPGFEFRSVQFVIDLSFSGAFIGIRSIDKEDQWVLCPSAGNITSGVDAHPVADKASVSICMDSGEDDPQKFEKLEKKRRIFLNRFQSGIAFVPEFQLIVDFLSDAEVMEDVRSAFLEMGGKPGDVVGFSVNGTDLWDLENVKRWWSGFKAASGMDDLKIAALDVVTGEPCRPARIWKNMKGRCAAGGQTSGVSLVSFNNSAFGSYGFAGLQNMNCPVSEQTAGVVMDAAIYLSNRAPSVENMRFLHWYSEKIPEEDDILDFMWDGFDFEEIEDANEDGFSENADSFICSPFKGSVPSSLSGVVYHILILQPQAARMIVRKYEKGNYADLYKSVSSWFEGLRMTASNGIVPNRFPKLYSLLSGLLTESEKASSNGMTVLKPFIPRILDSCFFGLELPNVVAYRAVSAFRSGMHPGSGSDVEWRSQYRRVQWLKLWIVRNKERKGGKCDMETDGMKASLNQECGQSAYVCGRLMAVYDMIQRQAVNLKSTVISRYFTACSQNPAMVLGKLQAMSVHHFENIRYKNVRAALEDELSQAWGQMGQTVPMRLSIEDQAYFACGYWQEMAELRRMFFGVSEADKKEEEANGCD